MKRERPRQKFYPDAFESNAVSLEGERNLCVQTTDKMVSDVIASSRLRREAYNRLRRKKNQNQEKNSEPITGHAVTTK